MGGEHGQKNVDFKHINILSDNWYTYIPNYNFGKSFPCRIWIFIEYIKHNFSDRNSFRILKLIIIWNLLTVYKS